MQNQIFVRDADATILVTNPTVNANNEIALNETVSTASDREAVCSLDSRFDTSFLRSGDDLIVVDATSTVNPTLAACTRARCEDGVLDTSVDDGTCAVVTVPFSCQAQNSNAGCAGSAVCPTGHSLVSLTAVCDLERGAVAESALRDATAGRITVVGPSDVLEDGACVVGDTTIRSGSVVARGVQGRVGFSCSERDAGGGDCHVSGVLHCTTAR
jgi:hypothetical protein